MAQFTVLIIGDEILSGRRVDQHFAAILQRLQARGHTLSSVHYLPDDPATLIAHFQRTLAEQRHVISCGGIGATPDDHTRAALASALNVPLQLQPQAAALIEQRFGVDAYPHRIKMALFPEGATLIPNPVNQVAGAAIAQHYLLPGFPTMAWPMVEWLLDQYYTAGTMPTRRSLTVLDAKEGDLIDIMQAVVEQWPQLTFSSLPSFGNHHCSQAHIEFSVQGDAHDGQTAIEFLHQQLSQLGYVFLAPISQ
ncbi:competence/damage-inducible protein A [Deefgea salmonis]|uniref:Competence/damage-inducible protein A n=1 Tax=Deefgea salmonis TaxID=2875502 RepID=A0ABS8BGL6_9NEIS|nr:molybdopterin-binding protein [Deefgea salmonis]MCB5194848.1 competence/damage-inducible protein A [Deefgea salmonis]